MDSSKYCFDFINDFTEIPIKIIPTHIPKTSKAIQ